MCRSRSAVKSDMMAIHRVVDCRRLFHEHMIHVVSDSLQVKVFLWPRPIEIHKSARGKVGLFPLQPVEFKSVVNTRRSKVRKGLHRSIGRRK